MKLDPPRWKNGPPICPAANLLAFKNEKEYAAFEASDCPRTKNLIKFTCRACGHLHYWGVAGDPSGDSSGTTRTGKRFEEVQVRAFTKFQPLMKLAADIIAEKR